MTKCAVEPLSGLEHVSAPSCQINMTVIHGHWDWVLAASDRALALTALGDLFVLRANGAVALLDVASGTALEVAATEQDFRVALHEPKDIEQYFVPQLVAALCNRDGLLQPGTCFSCIVPFTIGGVMSEDNYTVLGVESHLVALGKMQRQILKLPLGTVVSSVTLER